MYVEDSSVGVANRDWETLCKEMAEGLIRKTCEGLSVDWKEYWEKWGLVYNPEMHRAFQKVLLETEVLSDSPEGNFLVLVQPVQWAQPSLVPVGPLTTSPVFARTVLFFTRSKYAEEWARAWPDFETGQYGYYILQLSVSVQKSPVSR